jgi:hypothetical protein
MAPMMAVLSKSHLGEQRSGFTYLRLEDAPIFFLFGVIKRV